MLLHERQETRKVDQICYDHNERNFEEILRRIFSTSFYKKDEYDGWGSGELFLSGTYEVHFGRQGLRKWTHWEWSTVKTKTGMMSESQEKGGI